MLRLYQARDRIEAQFLHDFLERHLIRSVVLGDYLSGAIGQLPVDVYPCVWVIEDGDLPRARELLESFRSDADRGDAPSWVCRACGELVDGSFDYCWHCGAERPPPGG